MSITNLQIGDSATAVTPSDSTILTPGVLYIGVGGTVVVQPVEGEVATFVNVPDGYTLYVQVTKVLSTGTTATNILILR
jgi:hypothetical protein